MRARWRQHFFSILGLSANFLLLSSAACLPGVCAHDDPTCDASGPGLGPDTTLNATNTQTPTPTPTSTATPTPTATSAAINSFSSITIANLHNHSQVQTGFLYGTATGSGTIGVTLDGGAAQAAVGTSPWKFALPHGPGSWPLGSQHTIAVGALSGTNLSAPVQVISVIQGSNQDIDGDGYADLVIPSYRFNNGALEDGGIYIYYGGSGGIAGGTAGLPTIIGKAGSNEFFGSSFALGDINGDGYADLVVGAGHYNNGTAGDGGVYIYYGGSGGIASSTAGVPTIAGKASSQEAFGGAVAIADFDGDGYADLAIGAINWNNGSVGDGALYIYPGSALGIANGTAGNPTIKGKAFSGSLFGHRLAVGNINGDGYADLAVGADAYDNGLESDGGVYLYYGSATGLSPGASTPTIVGEPSSKEFFGQALAMGDLNGDGYADLIVGAYGYNNGAVNDGGVYVYFGTSGGIAGGTAGAPQLKGMISAASQFGYNVATGDFNGDGYADLVIQAANYNNGQPTDGGIYLYSGSASTSMVGIAGNPTIAGKPSSNESFGSILLPFDFNGDGYCDLAVGAWTFNNGTANDGGVNLYEGAVSGIPSGTAPEPDIVGKPSSGEKFGGRL